MKLLLALAVLMLTASSIHAQTIEELEAAEEATTAIWEELPLTQRSVTFVKAASTGYGLYEKRDDNVFRAGEAVITYLEPVGYGWKPLDNGKYSFGFVVDVALKTADGEVAFEQPAFLTNEQVSNEKNQEFSIDLTMTLNDAPVGTYTLAYTVHDITSEETSTFEQEFEIVE